MASSLALPPLVELVRDNGFIDDAQAEELVRAHLQDNKPYKELILALDVLSEEDLLSLMAGSQGTLLRRLRRHAQESHPGGQHPPAHHRPR